MSNPPLPPLDDAYDLTDIHEMAERVTSTLFDRNLLRPDVSYELVQAHIIDCLSEYVEESL